ncbi:MAG: HAD-IA family hydrolase, partial [Caldimonas sp.]
MKASAQAVLFDLDGTLIDSAPDLAGAGNEMRLARELPPLPYESFRPMVGSGARGMVGVALQVGPADAGYESLRDEFLQRYEARMTRETCIFPDMAPLLEMLRATNIPWGIVTNKATRFAVPLVQALGLDRGAVTLVCGDTTARAKPHPDPLLEAARRIGVPAGKCVYVGDDLRDVQAGRAAGMGTIAAAWGY